MARLLFCDPVDGSRAATAVAGRAREEMVERAVDEGACRDNILDMVVVLD